MTHRRLALIGATAALTIVASLCGGALGGRAQTPAPPTREALLLALDRLQADRWYPPDPVATSQPPSADRQMLDAALTSPRAELRQIAVRGVGRFETPRDVARLVPALDDADAGVRRAAAFAIAQALHKSTGADLQGAAAALRARYARETDARVKDTIAESIARLPYDAATSAQVIADRAVPIGTIGIQRVLQRLRATQVDEPTRQDLRRAAAPPAPQAPDVRALEILTTIADTGLDAAAVSRAVTYRCAGNADASCGADVRFAALGLLDARNDGHKSALTTALADPALRVRFQAARKVKASAAASGATGRWSCAPLLDVLADTSSASASHRIEALSLFDTRCEERDAATARLKTIAGLLSHRNEDVRWHVPARALETIAVLDRVEARRLVDEVAVPHPVAWVRAAAARTAQTIDYEAPLITLAADADPNVQTEAISLLTRRKYAGLGAVAVPALASADYQLVLTAASALRGVTLDASIGSALAGAVTRITREGKDTSRDPRLEILRRLREAAASSPTVAAAVAAHRDALTALLTDFDPTVAAAAADALGAATGTRPDPRPTRRAPQQPTEAVLRALPRSAAITMADGSTIGLTLFPDDAPLTVARFASLARAGYFNGLTFHRIAPYFVVQGGSPGANEYSGDARFMRDEIGFERHTAGSVGISTRGRDTGDAQIFIDLIDVHRLDFDYTVFARVRSGMTAVTTMQAGARIARIQLN